MVRASQYEDFFHMPSSESPLGGGLKMPSLPSFPSKRGDAAAEQSSVPDLKPQVFSKKSRVDGGGKTEKAPIASFTTSVLSDSRLLKSLRGLVAKALNLSMKVVAPVALAAILIQRAKKVYEERRKDEATRGTGAVKGEEEEEGAAGATKKRRLILPKFLGESTHEKLDKIQKDQEECWRVLHSVYKKHSSLEELMEEKLEESTKAVLSMNNSKNDTSEQIYERLALMEKRLIELDSLLTSIQTSVDKELSTLATKKELEEMVVLMKSFVEQLKVAISDGNGV